MHDIDAMVETLSAALAAMMTDDGPIPGSVLETVLESDDDFDRLATLLVFASERLRVSVAVADVVVGRLADIIDATGGDDIADDSVDHPD